MMMVDFVFAWGQDAMRRGLSWVEDPAKLIC